MPGRPPTNVDRENISSMELESALIKDFQRFSNSTIRNIPDSARLIILACPNGSGKSSLFDAMSVWHQSVKRPNCQGRRQNVPLG